MISRFVISPTPPKEDAPTSRRGANREAHASGERPHSPTPPHSPEANRGHCGHCGQKSGPRHLADRPNPKINQTENDPKSPLYFLNSLDFSPLSRPTHSQRPLPAKIPTSPSYSAPFPPLPHSHPHRVFSLARPKSALIAVCQIETTPNEKKVGFALFI